MADKFKCELLSPQQIEDICYRLAVTIKEGGFEPDVVIAVSRGGFIPARYICDFLHISNMTSIKVQYYNAATKGKEAVIKHPLNADIKGQKVLVVDDVNDSGNTLTTAREHLETFQPAELKFAVMQEKETAQAQADYYADYITDWVWLVYPWSVIEDVDSFIEEAGVEDDVEKIQAMLQRNYELELTPEQVGMVLRLRQE